MPLTTPPLINEPFAAAGDVTTVPPTDPNGFVNFNSGYTPDYELNLASGDPQAKAVERGIQNWLFNTLTTGLKAWQNANRPPWYNNMPGGYARYAEVVVDTGDGFPRPYRSLAGGNVTNPINSATWEYIEGTGELVKHVPMPTGGPAGSGSYMVSVATDFNTFVANGSWQFLNDAVVNGSPNPPANGGNKGQAGMLEVTAWLDGANSYVTQFYRDKAGLGFMRGSVNGTWTAWKIWANQFQNVIGEIRMWSGTATQAAVTAAWGPGWRLCDGTNGTPNLRDRFIIGSGTSFATGAVGGSSTMAINTNHLPPHNHVINISDPGHAHGVYDPGHNHGLHDPGHSHGVYDPGHNHGLPVGSSTGGNANSELTARDVQTRNWSDGAGTGISIYGNGTGISINASGANIGIYGSGTGISANSNNTGGGQAFSIMPPYYALAYVMYTGA